MARSSEVDGQAAASSSRHTLTLAALSIEGHFDLFLLYLFRLPVDGRQPGGQFRGAALPDDQRSGSAQQA